MTESKNTEDGKCQDEEEWTKKREPETTELFFIRRLEL